MELIGRSNSQLIYEIDDGTTHYYCKVWKGIMSFTLVLHENSDGTWDVISDLALERHYKTKRNALAFYHERLGALVAVDFTVVPTSEYKSTLDRMLGE